MEKKNVRIDWKGNQSVTSSWGSLMLPKHLNSFGRPDSGPDGITICKRAVLLAVFIALIAILIYFASSGAVQKP